MTENKTFDKVKQYYKNTKRTVLESMFREEENKTFKKIPILEASFNQTLKHIHSGAPIMFISACHNLDHRIKHTTEEIENQNNQNIEDSNKLNSELDSSGMFYIKANGHWICFDETENKFTDNPEFSFIIIGKKRNGNTVDFEIFKEIGIKLCKKYNQYAVMVGRNTDNGFDFKYYTQDGSVDNSFTDYNIDNPNSIKTLLEHYNSEIAEYVEEGKKLTEEEEKEFEELKEKYYGATTINNKNNTKRGLNIVFESITIPSVAMPYNRGISIFTENNDKVI